MREFEALGLDMRIAQCNISYNAQKGTLRGLHYQAAPHEEAKCVRCTRGAVYDVVLDLRPDSPTRDQWMAEELSDRNHQALYIPAGCAHGFQSLTDGSEVHYQMSEFFYADLARGVRWNDQRFAIAWPLPNPILSPRDAAHPDYTL
jgi:dTDP-4-dehydrorhamnose 3,5-epimerase